VGNSVSERLETYLEFNPVRAFTNIKYADLIIFSTYGYTNATYSGDHKDAATKDKKVENAPAHILRAGISVGYKEILLTGQVKLYR